MKDYDFDYYVTKPWLQEEVGLPEDLSSTLANLMLQAHAFLCSTNTDGLIEALEMFPELWTFANTYGVIHPRLVDFEHRHGATSAERERHQERVRKIEDFLTRKADPDSNNDWNCGKYGEIARALAGDGRSELQPLGSWNTGQIVKERPHAEAERIGRITRDKMLDEELHEV